MAIRINSNFALNQLRNQGDNNLGEDKMTRLSSGKRINTAGEESQARQASLNTPGREQEAGNIQLRREILNRSVVDRQFRNDLATDADSTIRKMGVNEVTATKLAAKFDNIRIKSFVTQLEQQVQLQGGMLLCGDCPKTKNCTNPCVA